MRYLVLLIICGCFDITIGFLSKKSDVLNSAKIVFYYGKSFKEYREILLLNSSSILQLREYDKSKNTLLYIHGYDEKLSDEHLRVIIRSYLARGDHNVFILDWSKISTGNLIFHALPNVIRFGKILTTAVLKMFRNGLKLENLHIVGHSLGCQLSSQVAQGIIKRSRGKKKLKRITGLDPGNLYIINRIIKALSQEDAEFVDIIYTDAPPNTYGTPVKTGHANFFPNGKNSKIQPGCPPRDYILFGDIELCSHQRSWRFWAESVASVPGTTFFARKCDSWSDFKAHKCESNEIVNFGIDCPPTTGDFYFTTNSKSPFSRGLLGASPKNRRT